jgi:hypothetical protein
MPLLHNVWWVVLAQGIFLYFGAIYVAAFYLCLAQWAIEAGQALGRTMARNIHRGVF